MAPTFWQFTRARWGRILLAIGAWTAFCLLAMPRLPWWVQWAINSLIWMRLAYQWGLNAGRAQAEQVLTEAHAAHRADLDRFVAYLREQRGYADRLHELMEQGEQQSKGQAN